METKTDRLFIIIPAYNERENIRQVLDDWYPVIQAHSGNGESRLVVIDDGSKIMGQIPEATKKENETMGFKQKLKRIFAKDRSGRTHLCG